MKWDVKHIQLLEWVSSWKKRAEVAEAKVEALLVRQDEMARQIEELQQELEDCYWENGKEP